MAAMHRMWSSKVKVADRMGWRRLEDEEALEADDAGVALEAPWGQCTVTCRHRESSLSVTT